MENINPISFDARQDKISMITPMNPTTPSKLPRQELHLLFSLFTTMLIGAVSRAGGIRVANQFEQQLNRYTRQAGWNFSTSPGDMKQGPPDMSDQDLLAAYRASADYALSLAQQVLGERLTRSALAELTESLTPQLRLVREQYELFNLA